MTIKRYILICLAILVIGAIGIQAKNTYDLHQKTFYRTEEVAIAIDDDVTVDEEGRIFVSNPYKETINVIPEASQVQKERELNPTIEASEDVDSDLQANIAIDNAKLSIQKEKQIKELLSSGETEMKSIMDEKIEEKRKEAEKIKAEQEAKRKKDIEELVNVTLTGVDDLRTPSNLTAAQLEKGLKSNLSGLGQYFIEAEKTYGVNAVFLASVAALESAWGTSNYAVKRNNLFGYGAYTSNPDNAYYFSSKRVAILYVAKKLKQDYLTENGRFFNGYNLEGVNKKYCTNNQWAKLVGNIMGEIHKKIKN